MKASIVLDVGTSSIRGILFSEKGEMLYVEQQSTPPEFLDNGYVEQSPHIWIDTILEILQRNVQYAEENHYVLEGIALTSQRSSLICLGKNGHPIGNAIMWQDKRTNRIVEELKDRNDFIFKKTGANLNPVYLAPKILWMKREYPDLDTQILKYLSIADYISYVLTGELKTDRTYASRTLLMNLSTKDWDDELLELFMVRRDQLCDLIEPGDRIGFLSEEISKQIGLKKSIPLISAGGDQQCGAVGMGVLSEGNLALTLGTGGYLVTIKKSIPQNLTNNITVNYYAISKQYMLETSILSCSSLLDWFLRNFYDEKDKTKLYQKIEQELLSVPAGSNGVMVQPYFQGRGTPDWNNHAKGHFLNLTLANQRKDLLHALIEGIGMEVAHHVDILKEYTNDQEVNIYLGGGMSNNAVISQMIADILSKKLTVSSNSEATALGAFVVSSIPLGFFPSHGDALRSCRTMDGVRHYHPEKEKQAFYQSLRKKQSEHYQKLNEY